MPNINEYKLAAVYVKSQRMKEIERLEAQLEAARHVVENARALIFYIDNMNDGFSQFDEDRFYMLCENAEIEFED